MYSWLADVHSQSGDREIAASIVEQTLREISDTTGRSWEAELHRQRAEMLLGWNPSKIAEAESHFKNAIELARRQNSKSLELRAAISLARLLRQQERIDQAREMLEPIYHWFGEGAATSDISRARGFLALH